GAQNRTGRPLLDPKISATCPLSGGAHLPERVNVSRAKEFQFCFESDSGGSGPHFMMSPNDAVEPLLGLFVTGVPLFFGAECGRVIMPAAVNNAGWVLDMKHFVEQNVFDEPLRDIA